MGNKLSFGWVLHQHQPVGNFPWVFAQVYEACYAPLLDAFERHPGVRANMHYSGPLLDWLLAEHPDYITRLARLVERGQIEMITGGYYEPILPILPEYDQYGQITKMSAAIRQHFNSDPNGLWLAERVWEPSLPGMLARAGVRYTVLDDTHFLMAGLVPEQLYGYYITEDQGHPLTLFPIPKLMRDMIPWKSVKAVEQTFRKLHEAAKGAPRIAVLGDDGEKFGSWPDTYDRIWRRGYMDQFMQMLEANADWLETVHLSEYRQREAPLGRVYLPTASYVEMMEWALPAKRSAEFENVRHELQKQGRDDIASWLRGGMWRNFAAKYPEANNFHKKMLRVHGKVRTAAPLLGPHKTQEALDELWKGQCNCGYWHGVFGGLYLADIRSAIYQHLVRAESIADGALPNVEPVVTLADLDCDGRDEILIEGPHMDVYIAPHEGGSIFEWDWKANPFNVVDTLARRHEAYHDKLLGSHRVTVVPPHDLLALPEHPFDEAEEARRDESAPSIHDIVQAKEPGLEKLLHYDALRRTALRERFFSAKTTLADVIAAKFTDQGDFAGEAFDHRVEGVGVDALVIDLWRDGQVRDSKGAVGLRLRKSIAISTNAPEMQVTYTLHNTGTRPLKTRFGIEGNWGMLGGGGNPAAWYLIDGERPSEGATLDARGQTAQVREVALVNSGVGVQLTLTVNTQAALWRFPVETVSNSESGFERVYQCSSTLFHWPVDIAPGDRWSVTLRLALGRP